MNDVLQVTTLTTVYRPKSERNMKNNRSVCLSISNRKANAIILSHLQMHIYIVDASV